MTILGIQAGHPDASAVLLRDGEWIAGAEEERYKRVKHWQGFPVDSLGYCLREGGISLKEVDRVALVGHPGAKWLDRLKFLLRYPGHVGRGWQHMSGFRRMWETHFPGTYPARRLVRVEHHRAHAASAYFGSPFEEALFFTADGAGDFSTSLWGVGRGDKLDIWGSSPFPHSQGLFYTAGSQFLGFGGCGDEYKVMGLAAYGEPVYLDALLAMFHIFPDGQFQLRPEFFKWNRPLIYSDPRGGEPILRRIASDKWASIAHLPRLGRGEPDKKHADFAASLQAVWEYLFLGRLRHLARESGQENLCLAGGCMQNSVALGKIAVETPFRQIYLPSASHDAGTALGAAWWVYHALQPGSSRMPVYHAFRGERFAEGAMRMAFEREGLVYREITWAKLPAEVAGLLARGAMVGWFQGRAEFGPRALGNRSILANPAVSGIRDRLNACIKERESFRPFAVSVLFSKQEDHFGVETFLPFMEQVIRPRGKAEVYIREVLHVDGTVRLHSIRPEENPLFHKLVQAFFQVTGIPALINTSFNRQEPIVHSPEDALRCFRLSGLDYLVMGPFLVKKP